MTPAAFDQEGFLVNLEEWHPDLAAAIAEREGLELTESHWSVIEALRDFYKRTEVAPSMRPFVKLIRQELGEDLGTSIMLMTLFGESPAKNAAKIAGLPRPTNCL